MMYENREKIRQNCYFLQEWYVGMFKKMENIVITKVEQLVVNQIRVVK